MTAKLTTQIMRLTLAVLCVPLLTKCSSVERAEQPTPEQQLPASVEDSIQTSDRTAGDWLQQAAAADSNIDQLRSLLNAAEAFQQQQQWQHAAAILSQIETVQLTRQDFARFKLMQARWFAYQQQWQTAISELEPQVQYFQTRERRLQGLSILAKSHAALEQYWQASQAQIEAEQYNGNASPDQSRAAIWAYLRQARADELPATRPLANQLAGWWRLAKLFHQHASKPTLLAESLRQWQSSYPEHLAADMVATWLQQPWQDANHVVALLPLTGDYAKQGIAVRDGLLAAASKSDLSVSFIDTQTTPLAEQQSAVIEAGTTHIVGPLLKSQVEQWKNQPLPGVYHLLLNETTVLPSSIIGAELIEFALAPEDEARQAARYLTRQSKLKPLILAASSRGSERVVEAFQQQRELLNQQPAELGWYQSRDQMQAVVEQKLGIEASKQRIREVKIAAGKIIVDEQERSRADLDAVYLPGNLAQVRLLKPFIDVNLSPFAPPLTVYGNSDVHQRANRFGDADLQGVVFTETPGLLNRNGDSESVAQWLNLRSDANLNEARLFAMGYDSIPLLNHLMALMRFPGGHYRGVSGTLQVPFGRVQRTLDWATFTRESVQAIE